jgi:hypothetical protein
MSLLEYKITLKIDTNKNHSANLTDFGSSPLLNYKTTSILKI